MKNLFLIIVCNIFCSMVSSDNIFIVDSAPNNIISDSIFLYLLLDIKNLNVSDVLYLNYQNFLYQDNILTINGNMTFNKLPLLKEGNYFLVLDSNNQLGIYDALVRKKNLFLTYDTMTLNNIQSIDQDGIKISSTSGKNTLMKEINKFYAIGNEIYFDGIIKNTKTANIYSSDGIADISVANQITASGDINCGGDNFYVETIDSKSFFSFGSNITLLTNVYFKKNVLFNKNKNPAKFYFGNNAQLLFKKNFIIKNIKDYGKPSLEINFVGIDKNGNLTYFPVNISRIQNEINIYPKEKILNIGNNKYSLWFGGSSERDINILNDNILNITNLTCSANITINSGSSNLFYNADNVKITNFITNVLPDKKDTSTYSFGGKGEIVIDKINIEKDIYFQNNNQNLIIKCSQGIPIMVTDLDAYYYFDDFHKPLVIANSSGLLAYIDNAKINLGKDEIMSDVVLYNNLSSLYMQFGNKDLTLNNEIIEYIKERLRKKESNELLDKLFLYDEKSDDLLYNVVFAEELLTSKIMNIENQEISIQEEAEMEQDIDQDLLNIKDAIFSILSEKHRKANL